jgi:hypothetical protein
MAAKALRGSRPKELGCGANASGPNADRRNPLINWLNDLAFSIAASRYIGTETV